MAKTSLAAADDIAPGRSAAIMRAVVSLQADLLPGETGDVIVCAGPPICLLRGATAHARQRRGCPDCTVVAVNAAADDPIT
jgi:hypothetical protein